MSYYKNGDFNAICDFCGKKFKASKLKKTWDGYMVCPRDWEPRQPQDFVRGVEDDSSTPFSKPEATATFVAAAVSLPLPE